MPARLAQRTRHGANMLACAPGFPPVRHMSQSLSALRAIIQQAMLADQPAFRRRLAGLERRRRQGKPWDRGLQALEEDLRQSIARRTRRAAGLPSPHFPEALPVNRQRSRIEQAIRENQVVIVAGETGSGKTTQLPKIALALGLGAAGMIGCTQPRRIAARSMAERVAEELGVTGSNRVAHQVRFTDHTGPDTLVKFMTDGILLAETRHDPLLLRYEMILIDEAHERSLNIDFLLGYLKRILPQRPDLKVVVTSATIDTQRFAQHFGNAPVIEVSGRGHPVEVRYRPLEDAQGRPRELNQGILEGIHELDRTDPRGDILVFLPTERDIHDCRQWLQKQRLAHTEILPLYARLSAADQQRIFHPGPQRRVILATNIAETSLTVPRIRFVIDSGLARISRYNPRSRVQRLPVEPISQAAANQRAGRCGRLGPGICIRLYDEADFAQRPAFTQPEIQRTALATVMLRMLELKLGELEDFPFIDPPDARQVKDARQELAELQALDERGEITPLGRELARLPVDVRFGRLLIAGRDQGCLREMLVLVAALSLQDPRERPPDHQQAADQAHAEFRDGSSDFTGYLRLWDWFHQQRKAQSRSRLRETCQRRFIHYLRMLEWQDLHRQLQGQIREMQWPVNTHPADEDNLHRALLPAFLAQVGMQDEKTLYTGARGRKFHLFPASALARKPPRWLVAAEIVETSRTWARTCAAIDPAWLETAGAHLLKRRYHSPWWSKKRGRVMGKEQVTLFGLPIVQERDCHYAPHDPETARQLFLQHGLVEGQLKPLPEVIAANLALRKEVEELEHRQRRQDLLVADRDLARFYDQRLPAEILDAHQLRQWLQEPAHARSLAMRRQDLLLRMPAEEDLQQFPEHITLRGQRFRLSYHFQPGESTDGVTLHVPLERLNSLDEAPLSWLVPGMLREKLETLLRALPKPQRRALVPIPQTVNRLLEPWPHWPQETHLYAWLSRQLARQGIRIPQARFEEIRLPEHLYMNLRLEDAQGGYLGQSRELETLKARHGQAARQAFSAESDRRWHRDGLLNWDFGPLPEEVPLPHGGRAWPAIVEGDDGRPALRLVDNPGLAREAQMRGVNCWARQQLAGPLKQLKRKLPLSRESCLLYKPVDDCENLKEEVIDSLLQQACERAWNIRDAGSWQAFLTELDGMLWQRAHAICTHLDRILPLYHEVRKGLQKLEESGRHPQAWQDLSEQLDNLLYPGFLLEVNESRLSHYPRYLRGMRLRLERLDNDPARDRQRQAQIQPWWDFYQQWWNEHQQYTSAFDHYRWLLEEYRISLFAQELKTAQPVSEKRLAQARKALENGPG